MKQQLDKIIQEQLNPGEDLQPEVNDFLMRMIPKVIEVGVIKNDGNYRFSREEVCERHAIRRIINNLHSTLKSNEGYKIGLVDTTRKTLDRQHETVASQVRNLLPSEIDSQKKSKLAVDIADVILTSWLLVDCLPNESGYGNVWASS